MAYDTNHGKCNYCGADRVENPKTGKIFCSAKCWLKKSPTPIYSGERTQSPSTTSNVSPAPISGSTERIIELLTSIDSKLEAIHDKLPLYAEIDGKQERVPF